MKHSICLFFFVATFCLFNNSAKADWVMLSNGDRISGTITNQGADAIQIETEIMGNLTIPRARIASYHTGQPPRVLARELRTGQPLSHHPTKTADITKDPVATETAKPEEKKQEERQQGVFKWSGHISAGGTIQDGNSRSKTFTADADVKGRDKNNRIGLGGEANWAEDDGEKTDNDQQVYASYDRFITEKWFLGGRQSLEKDEFEELDLRSQTGLFAGYQFYEQDDLNLQVKAGPDYIYEDFENGDTEHDLALSWALEYDQKVADNAVQIFHNHELSSPFSDTGAFLFESETGARVPIGEKLDASAQIDFDWDNDPTPGVREDDTTYAIKLGYGW
jgi:putative salt-induced outer membrane protein YdiY